MMRSLRPCAASASENWAAVRPLRLAMLANILSMSPGCISTPKRWAVKILRRSSISWSSACFWVSVWRSVSCISLMRWATSKLVIGRPCTMTSICWAEAGAPPASASIASPRTAAAPRRKRPEGDARPARAADVGDGGAGDSRADYERADLAHGVRLPRTRPQAAPCPALRSPSLPASFCGALVAPMRRWSLYTPDVPPRPSMI